MVLRGSPKPRVGAIRLWAVVVVIVPLLVTTPAVGTLNNEAEVEVAAAEETVVLSDKRT